MSVTETASDGDARAGGAGSSGLRAELWEDVWTAPWEMLSSCRLMPGCQIGEDLWVLPRDLASSGTAQRPGDRTLDFRKALPTDWSREEQRSEHALRRLKRIAVLVMTRTVQLNERVRNPSTPSTSFRAMRSLCSVARAMLEERRNGPSVDVDRPLFADMSPDDMSRWCDDSRFRVSVPRLNGLYAAKVFDDWPATDVYYQRREEVPVEPLPDHFVASVLTAAIWVVETIGPDIIECWRALRQLPGTPRFSCRTDRRRALERQFLAEWKGETLKPGFRLAHPLLVPAFGHQRRPAMPLATWPPEHPHAVRHLAFLVQCAHAVVIAFSTAARDGEIAGLPRDCLVERVGQDLLSGYTFKTSDNPGGEKRHWPLPKIAVRAVLQQNRLAEMVAPKGKELFVRFSGGTEERVFRVWAWLGRFAEVVATPEGHPIASVCEARLGSLSIRKSVVRLAALSLVGSNGILVDVLGHRDPEMTLGYILSAPGIQEEVRTVADEAMAAIADRAVAEADVNGGPAAAGVAALARRQRPRAASPELEAQGLKRAAEILALGGGVSLVRRNVLCTKAMNQAGPCTRRAGRPDAGNCQVDCGHRLELAAARADHRLAIDQVLEEIPDDDGPSRVWWQAQLVSHLTPFPDLMAEVESDPRLQAALAGIAPDELRRLGPSPSGSRV